MYRAGDVRVEDVDDPVIQQPTDAIVQVVRACVCGSDLHPWRSMPASQNGVSMGHELIGVVQTTGSAVSGVDAGDFVIAPFAFQDNTCSLCRDGFQTSCPNGGFYGANGQAAGLQAELARIPQADGSLVKVPGVNPDTADESLLASLLTLSDVYLTGYHGAHIGHVGPGSTVTVIGDGAVGLSAVLASAQLGAEQIILASHHRDRAELGRQFGATDIVDGRGDEAVEQTMALTDGVGSPVVIEAVGLMPAYAQAYQSVRPGGIISRVGAPQYEDAPVGFGSLFAKNATLTGGPAPVRAYLDQAVPQVLSGRINPGRVFDRTVALDDIAQGYQAMNDRTALKVMVHP